MTDEEFKDLVRELQKGNRDAMGRLFLDHFDYCVSHLTKEFYSGNHYCSDDDAKDTVMEGVIKLTEELAKGKVENKNIRGFLLTICRNMWLKKVKKDKSTLSLDIDKVEHYLGQKVDLYNEDFNPLLKKEQANELTELEKTQADNFTAGWAKLGDKCKKLLTAFYIEKKKLKDLQEHFGYSSYDSIKTMRKKCYRNLTKWVDKLSEKN